MENIHHVMKFDDNDDVVSFLSRVQLEQYLGRCLKQRNVMGTPAVFLRILANRKLIIDPTMAPEAIKNHALKVIEYGF